MVIAVNLKYFLKQYKQSYLAFMCGCVSQMAQQQPEHSFIFFSDTAFDPSFRFTKNSVLLPVVPGIKSGFISAIFYNIKITSLLKKYGANVFINADGFCSPFTKVSQLFMLHHPGSLSDKEFIKKNDLFLYKIKMPSFLKRAKVIVTETGFSKNHLIQQYKTAAQKIDVVYNSISEPLEPIDWQQNEKIRSQYAGGYHYFLFSGDTSQQGILMNVLKAFSQFKKWQKSAMQLLIVKSGALHKKLNKSLELFKYQNDVHVLNNLPPHEFTKVAAAAYSMIYLPVYESFSPAGLQAMKSNIPLIVPHTEQLHEIYGNAVLYANFDDPVSIAEKLMRIFKDEELRQELIQRAGKQLQKYNPDRIVESLWHSILKAGL